MLTANTFTPQLVNLESLTAKPRSGGGSRNCAASKVEEAVHYVVHIDKVTADSYKD